MFSAGAAILWANPFSATLRRQMIGAGLFALYAEGGAIGFSFDGVAVVDYPDQEVGGPAGQNADFPYLFAARPTAGSTPGIAAPASSGRSPWFAIGPSGHVLVDSQQTPALPTDVTLGSRNNCAKDLARSGAATIVCAGLRCDTQKLHLTRRIFGLATQRPAGEQPPAGEDGRATASTRPWRRNTARRIPRCGRLRRW